MLGVRFGNYHSYDDFRLLLSSKEIGSPTVKIMKIDVEGADGALDLTDFFGSPKYHDVTHKFQFSSLVPQGEQIQQFTAIKKAVHGKKLRIILDDEPGFYYVGRCFVSAWTNEKNVGIVAVECECEPYKLKSDTSAALALLCGKNYVNLDSRKSTRSASWTKTATGYQFNRATTGNGYCYWEIPVIKGRKYTFSASGTTYTGGAPSLYIYKTFTGREVVTRGATTSALTFTAEETQLYAFCLVANSTTETADFKNVMVTESATQQAYEAYSGVEQTKTLTFSNLHKPAIPVLHLAGSMVLSSGNISKAVTSGTQALPEFQFNEGNSTITFTGNGVASVEWQEGAL